MTIHRPSGNSSREVAATRENQALRYEVCRVTTPVPAFAEFQHRYEEAVPDLPAAAVNDLVSRNAPWSEMLSLVDQAAPHGFLIYFRNDVGPVMRLAHDTAGCVSYLMGNHTIAERMFRYDPSVMLYAPLHTAIWQDHDGSAWFTFDQPSTQFSSFGIPEVASVGRELDHELARLLDALEVDVPSELRF